MFLKVDDHQILQVECRPLTCIVLIVWELRNAFTSDGSVELIIYATNTCVIQCLFHAGLPLRRFPVADPKCARGGGVSHILAEKKGVSFTLFKKMQENAIFSPIRGGGRTPMLDPPLVVPVLKQHLQQSGL